MLPCSALTTAKYSEDTLLRAIGEIEILVEERRAAERQKARSKNKKGLSQ
jgi:hypothetical protein